MLAYLNCPFCPSQAVPANIQTLLNSGVTRFRCINGHFSFVYTEDITGDYGDYKADAEEVE